MRNLKIIISIIIIAIFFLGCGKSETATFGADGGGNTGTGGSMARFTIVGNYLYTVDKADLKVYDISAPANTVLVNTISVGFEIETIFPFKNRLFIGSTSVVHIFNIDNPRQPVKLSTAISPEVLRRCDPVVAKDSVAYATLRTNGACGGTQSILATYDIKDITNPKQVSTSPVSEPYGLGYKNNTLYVCDRFGLKVYNISNAYNPVFVGSVNNTEWFFDVITDNNYLYAWIKTGLMIYDITNQQNPVLIKKIM
jgi:hypothetical protein